MLKKLNGKITKSLFYLKNNFFTLLFKLCVLTTMLILIYLVCILKQTGTARRGEYVDRYPIESSQKLMLTTTSTTSECPSSTTEEPTTTDSFLSETSDYDETQPIFPLQEQTTTSMVPDQTTTESIEQERTEETIVNPSEKPTIPFKRSLPIDELFMWETTTESLKMDTTSESEDMPLEEQDEEEQEHSTDILTSTTTDSSYPIEETTTLSPTTSPEYGELFMDSWSNYLPTEYDNTPAEETSSQLNDIQELPEDIFLGEDNESGALETPILEHDSSETSTIEEHLPLSGEEIELNPNDFKSGPLHKDNKMFSLELPPILSPTNLFNLFSLDHLPAPSNVKPRWWSRSKNGPLPAGTPVKNRKRHANSILPIQHSEEVDIGPNRFQHVNQFRSLDRLLNKKLKDSVNFFERLFGNFHQQ